MNSLTPRCVSRTGRARSSRMARPPKLRATFEQQNTMVASARSWNSAECWLDSTCGVVRHEREAVGLDGEQYAWTRLFVFEARDGRCTGLCEFEVDDAAAAFAYAEERARAADTGRDV